MLERENHNEDKKSLRSLAARFITDVSVCAHPVWVSRQLFEGSGFDADGATRITNGKTQQRKGSMVVMHRITGELLCTTTAVFTGSSTMSEQPWGYAGSKVRGGMLCDEPGLGKVVFTSITHVVNKHHSLVLYCCILVGVWCVTVLTLIDNYDAGGYS